MDLNDFLQAVGLGTAPHLELRTKRLDQPGAHSQFFPSATEFCVAADAANDGGTHVWFGVAPRTTRRGRSEDCATPDVLWADLDPENGGVLSEGYWEYALGPALRRHLPPPTVVVQSGRGLQLYWRLAEAPADWEDRSRGLVHTLRAALAGLPVKVDSVHDRARVMRVPGTTNPKNSVPAKIIALDTGLCYDPGVFEVAVATQEPEQPVDGSVGEGDRNNTLWSIGAALKHGRRHPLRGEALQSSIRAINSALFTPPLPPLEVDGIVERLNDPTSRQPLTVAESQRISTEADVAVAAANHLVSEIMSVRVGGRAVWHCWNEGAGVWSECPVEGRLANWLRDAVEAAQGDIRILEECLRVNKLKQIVGYMASDDTLPTYLTEEALDTDPFVLPLRNCYLSLRDGTTFAPDPSYRFSRRAEVSWVEGAEAPLWRAFLDQMLPSADEQRFLGTLFFYCLTGNNSARAFFMNLGVGRNGKTVAWTVLRKIMGSFAADGDHRVVTKSATSGSHDAHISQLSGLRLCLYDELGESDELAASQVKRLTGGTTVRARAAFAPKHEDIKLTAKHVLVSNHRPKIQGEDMAVVDRLRYLGWDVRLSPEQVDPDMLEKLLAERDGILQWIVAHREDYMNNQTLAMPQRLADLAQAYAEEENDYLRFIKEFIRFTPGACHMGLSAKRLALGRKWEETMGVKLHGRGWSSFERELCKQLELLGCEPITKGQGDSRVILGIAMVEPGEELLCD